MAENKNQMLDFILATQSKMDSDHRLLDEIHETLKTYLQLALLPDHVKAQAWEQSKGKIDIYIQSLLKQ